MSIYLIRHGQTAGNADRRLQQPDVPLNDLGLEQASKLGVRLASAGIGTVLSSDLTRAHQTAEAVANGAAAPLQLEPLLQERNFGEWRGMRYDDVGPDLFDETSNPPGGESGAVFCERADLAWERIVAFAAEKEGAGHIAVVTHGLMYRALFARHLIVETAGTDGLPNPGNTAVSIIEHSPPHNVSLFACTAHLD
ncbi:MAG: putative phosphoglycerate mutase [Myxococcota bacterium]|jgi:probable phosphoglycerate mutase